MRPTLFSVGIFDFHAYTVTLALAFLMGTLLSVRANYRLERPYPITPLGGLWVFLGALFGAKLYWQVQYGEWNEVYRVFYLWEGGLVFYGGLFGGILGAVVYLKAIRVPVAPVGDIVMQYLPLAHAIARTGCFLNGCCWGAPTSVPWAVTYPKPSLPYSAQLEAGLLVKNAEAALPIHPTQLYESSGLIVICLLMLYAYGRPRRTGSLLLLYPFLYGILRFSVEAFRGDSARPVADLTVSQIVAIVFVLGSTLVYLGLRATLWRHAVTAVPSIETDAVAVEGAEGPGSPASECLSEEDGP